MAAPQPGDVGVKGVVAWVHYMPLLGISVGQVEAFASIYGTPPFNAPNPNKFSFWQDDVVNPGHVTFNVAAGNHANIATNVQNV
jgi:hypothetical protein